MSGEKWALFEDQAEAKGFALVPNSVLRSPRISLSAKSLYAILKSYAWQDDETYPGVKTLCASAGVSKDTLGKYLKELVAEDLIAIKRRGQGKTNLYMFKSVATFLDRDKGSHPDGDTGSHQDGDPSTHNEDSGNKDSVDNSRRDAGASSNSEKKNQNWFTVLCDKYKEVNLIVTDDDRDRYASNLARCVMQHEATDAEMHRVINHIINRRLEGVFLGAQTALNDIRGIRGESKGKAPTRGSAKCVIEAIANHQELSYLASVAREWDFAKPEAPPYPILLKISQDSTERSRNLVRLQSIAKKAVREAV
jgi:hypothetical protein